MQTASSRPVPTGDDPAQAPDDAPFQVRGHAFTAVVLRIAGPVGREFEAAIDAMMRASPQFYLNAPIVLDVATAEGLETKADFLRLVHMLRTRKLFVTGIQNATDAQSTGAFQAGLVTLRGGRAADMPSSRQPQAPDVEPEVAQTDADAPAPAAGRAMIVTDPVRSGQRIYAEHGDLVVVAPVSAGAELIAGGNIHVYGALRGRALAGVHGDAQARIFCSSLEADLVAIAGLYMTSEDISRDVLKQPVQAYLDGDTLCIARQK